MRELNQLQINFQDYLLYRQSNIKAQIISTAKVSALTRLDIYYDAYNLRLVEVLQEDYPGIHALIGCERFNELGRNYLAAFPSHFRSVRWFGKSLSRFLRDTKPYSAQPWLAEMAEFEWSLTEAFDAHDRLPVTVEQMATIPLKKWATMRFMLHPSLRSINLRWNVVSIWENKKKQVTNLSPQQAEAMTNWIVWRKEFAIQFCSLSVDKAYMIDALSSGHDFSFICAGLCEWIDENNVAMHAATLLKGFIIDGLITQIILD